MKVYLRTLAVFTLVAQAAAAGPDGAKIYQKMCARCHGDNGQGDEKRYPEALTGNRSVGQLARVIAETMPESDPKKCVGADAEAVARHIYDKFYSPEARARNKPPRVALSRLTVEQYRNAVADLMGHFLGRADAPRGEAGLTAEYSTSRSIRRGKTAFKRVDKAVDFDFGKAGPLGKKAKTAEFGVRWTGSIIAPETGTYEFTVKTTTGAELWVNARRWGTRPLIDLAVNTGKAERRASVFLLGGRAYPITLELTRIKQVKTAASVRLSWKPPHGVEEVIPARALSPKSVNETYVCGTPFPPDDQSYGWVRGTTVSAAWDRATTAAAIEAANFFVGRLERFAWTKNDGPERRKRVRQVCGRLVERAFGRPLTDKQRRLYIDRQFAEAPDEKTAVKRVVLLALKSPRFLYLGLGPDDDFAAARRLSFALWDSLPDEKLWGAAARGRLSNRRQVRDHATRMLADGRARAKADGFFAHWLKLNEAHGLAKDAKKYPEFTPAVIADLRTSLRLFIDEVVWGENPDLRRLLTAKELFLNGRLAKLYGEGLPEGAPFRKVTPDGGRRAGVLTHPYLMASFAYPAETSPIHRGVFLARGLLGVALKPPPVAVSPLAADTHPGMTTRERVAVQTKPAACMTCHGVINPLGFSLEQYDTLGRFRTREAGRPIDATGGYETRSGRAVKFAGAQALAAFLADSPEAHAAFVEQMFHHLAKQPTRAYGFDTPKRLQAAFARSGFNIRELMADVAATAALPPKP